MVIAWGVFAFGSVYPWAYIPLIAASAAVGLGGLFHPAPGARIPVALVVALAAVAVACSALDALLGRRSRGGDPGGAMSRDPAPAALGPTARA